MPDNESQNRRIYVGLQEGVCAVSGQGETWICSDVTPLAHAAARLTASPMVGGRAYLAAYEAGVYRTSAFISFIWICVSESSVRIIS